MKKKLEEEIRPSLSADFKINRSKIRDMYKDDKSVVRNMDLRKGLSSSVGATSLEQLNSDYFNLTTELEKQRKYSEEAYTFFPTYANLIDSLSNMYYLRYTYVPRLIKDKKSDYTEMYNLMGEVVDGLAIETTIPMLLQNMYIYGAVYITVVRTTNSRTLTTLVLPPKYCRPVNITQFGFTTFQFDFSYFDSLGVTTKELEELFEYYPEEMKDRYLEYKKDTQHKRWQELSPYCSAAFIDNTFGFPTKLYQLFAIKQYQQYLNNELERSEQALDKIVTHKIPVYQDKLVVDMDEMTELHSSMAQVINKNKHTKLVTSFGDIDVKGIGQDTSKENKTLENANNALYDSIGENHNIYTGDIAEALNVSLLRDKCVVWKYIQEISLFFNIAVNNSFNFKGYQCDITILPITVYDEERMLTAYKEGGTLGITKLEYAVALGTKQIDLQSKFLLEDFLGLDKLKPFATSYTQTDNTQKQVEDKKQENVENKEEENNNE